MKFFKSIAALFLLAVAAFAMPATAMSQSIDEITKAGVLRVGIIPGSPPFCIIDKDGKFVGYDIDFANAIANSLKVKLELVPLTPAARIPSLLTGKVDLLVAILAPTPERAKVVMFTAPYSGYSLSIMSTKARNIKGLDDLKGLRVGVPRSGTPEAVLTRLAVEGMTLVRFDDDATTSQALLSGQVDATGIPQTMAKEIISQNPNAGIELKFAFAQQPNSLAVRKGAFEFHQWLNNTIYFMRINGELDQISQKWLGEKTAANLHAF